MAASSRREFLMGAGSAAGVAAAAAAGAGALTATAHADEPAPAGFDYECDVVIAGAGVGGLCAAVASAEQGANTILVEASGHVGGTSRFAAGAFGPRYGTDWDYTYSKVPLSDPELSAVVLDNWDETLAWIQDMGLVTEALSEGSSYVWMGGKRPEEQGSKSYTDEYLQQFGEIFTEKGGTTILSTKAVEILTEDHVPCGLRCAGPNGEITIGAKSVIIATGGFQCNKEMMTRYIGRFADISQAQCIPYLDGSGITMAQNVGAKLSKSFAAYYGHPQPWPQNSYCLYDTPEAYEACENIDDVHLIYYGATVHAFETLGVYTNCDGKRFVDETLTSSLVNQEIMEQLYARAYLFIDEASHQYMLEEPYCYTAIVGGDRIEWLRDHGAPVFQADTLEELADIVHNESVGGDKFNVHNFLNTVREWNEAAANGEELDIPGSGIPLTTPPFYCIPVVPGVMATFGGIKIDTNSQVIGWDDKPMPGLWAVPGAAGGIMEGDYWCVMSGYSVFGRVAGINAAKAALGA